MYVILSSLYLGYAEGVQGWYSEIAAAATADMTSYGEYLGNRYKDYDNIIWLLGYDHDPTAIAGKVNAVAGGILANDTNHLITYVGGGSVEVGGPISTDNLAVLGTPSWITLNSAYLYSSWTTYLKAAYDYSQRYHSSMLRDCTRTSTARPI